MLPVLQCVRSVALEYRVLLHVWKKNLVYQSSLGFDERPVLSVDLVVKAARVAEILPGAVASPQRSGCRAAVDALTTFCNPLLHYIHIVFVHEDARQDLEEFKNGQMNRLLLLYYYAEINVPYSPMSAN